MAAQRYKRRTFILKNTAQPRYIFACFIIFILGVFLFSAIFSLLSLNTTAIAYHNQYISVGNTPSVLLTDLLGSGWLIVVLGGLLLFIVVIFLTHRIAGPMFRLNRCINEMAAGNFAFTIKLREKDDGQEMADSLNRLSEVISEEIVTMRRLTDTLQQHIETRGISEEQTEIKDLVDQLQNHLQWFAVKP